MSVGELLGYKLSQMKTRFSGLMISIGLAVISGFVYQPGFVGDDSRWMMGQAISANINDWHPHLLIWTWGQLLGAEQYGPLLPFLFQVTMFWTGIGLLATALKSRLPRFSILFPVLIFFVPQTFLVYWVSTDGAFLAIAVLALGLCAFSSSLGGTPIARKLQIVSIFLASLTYIPRPYLWVIFALFLISVSLFQLRRRHWAAVPWKLLVLGVVGLVTVPILSVPITSYVVKPADAFPESPVILMDLMAIECETRAASASVPEDGLLPRVFVVNNVNDFCEDYTRQGSMMRYFVNPEDRSSTKITWIDDDTRQLAIGAWLGAIVNNPEVFLLRKISCFVGSIRWNLFGSQMIPNDKWASIGWTATGIGLGESVGFVADLSEFGSYLLTTQTLINESLVGRMLMSPGLLLMAVGAALILAKDGRVRRDLTLVSLSGITVASFFFLAGMTNDGSRYYQTVFFITILGLIATVAQLPQTAIREKLKSS